MIKNNLPVILLKGFILLPHEDARVELNNDITKKIIDISKLYHNNEILVVTPLNDLEETPDTGDLPKIGVTAKITSRIDLPNGNTRIVLRGEKRVKVLNYVNYSNEQDILESIVVLPKIEEYNEIEETALLRILMNTLDKYISLNPYISNSILSRIKGITDLDKITDYIANFIPLSFEKKLSLMLETNRIGRAKKLITEINIELEVLELENKIEFNLKKNIDGMQKEMILKEKIKAIKEELGETDSKTEYISSINKKLENKTLPENIMNRINDEIHRYEMTPESSPEISVITSYLDYLVSLPWGLLTEDEKNLFIVEQKLESTHYGLNEVKERIIEYIGASEMESKLSSPIICLVGPPGVGKTSLAKSIADSLNKNFVKISLGGINDPAELLGHRKTYIGSSPGKIITALIKAKSENPVILLDEIDKLEKDYKGDPASALLDILDKNESSTFTDAYIDEQIDLSGITWVLTANDKSLIPYVLLDRLEIIDVPSYLNFEKVKIAENYLIPNTLNKYGIKQGLITFDNSGIEKIINDYTKEAGVRELERLIEKIVRKIIVKNKTNNQELEQTRVTSNNVKEFLNTEKYLTKSHRNKSGIGFTRGLAYTPFGGETLEIEVTSYKGKEEFITSGSLGSVLEESIKIALSYIKSNIDKFGINKEELKSTIHINFREGSIPKDGPSAGTIITTTLISYLLKKKVPDYISMTGEITLLGDVLPVGGLREKSVAAIREGITTIFISKDNLRDVGMLDDEIKNKIKFIPVKNYMEIFESLFESEKKHEKREKNNIN